MACGAPVLLARLPCITLVIICQSAPHPPQPSPAQVEELTLVPHVSRELMLIKVNCSASQRGELVSLASVRPHGCCCCCFCCCCCNVSL